MFKLYVVLCKQVRELFLRPSAKWTSQRRPTLRAAVTHAAIALQVDIHGRSARCRRAVHVSGTGTVIPLSATRPKKLQIPQFYFANFVIPKIANA